jgi:hypothetical protein
MDAAILLDPFAMQPALPASDYYGSSVPPRQHRPATDLPVDPPKGGSVRDRRVGSHVHF